MDETVQYQLIKKRSSYHEAKLIEVQSFSNVRTQPECRHSEVCGGCSLQHMQMSAQLELKLGTLLDQLKHFGKVTPTHVLPALTDRSVGYRRKARLGVKYVEKKQKLLVGFREKNGRLLADIETCAVLHPKIGQRLPQLTNVIQSLTIYREIPQVEIAIGDEDIALLFRVLSLPTLDDLRALEKFGIDHGFQIYLQPNPPAEIEKIWPNDNNHFLKYTLPRHDLEYLFHPTDFTQINLELNRLMIDQAIAFLDLNRQDTVLDLFCGLGNFTLPIAKYSGHVVGIEGSDAMVMRAKMNAEHNQIVNTDFYAADLMLEESHLASWAAGPYDKILLDPPRAGAKTLLPLLKQFDAKKIVYISCNPATLSRDAGEIVHQHGYRLTHAGIMNMFPHTTHIEAMAVFEK